MAKRRDLKPRAAEDTTNSDLFDDDDPFKDIVAGPSSKKSKNTAPKKAPPKKTAKKSSTSAGSKPDLDALKDKITPGKTRVYDYDAADKRKLTKKAQNKLKIWHGEHYSKARDVYFKNLAADATRKFGASVYAGSDINNLIIGIPFPSLALEWLTENDVFPLSLVTLICGRWGSCKSALLYEIFRWFAALGGGGILMENETKFSDDLCSSIMGIKLDECPIIVNRSKSLEDWQKRLTWWVHEQKRNMMGTKEEPGPGRIFPICFGVDSVMGKASEEKMEKIAKQGHSGRDAPTEALSLAGYFRSTCGGIDGWPFSFVFVNHLKTKVVFGDSDGADADSSPGGDFTRFQESFEWRNRAWKSKIETESFDGIGIEILCAKNSIGVTKRRIKTRMLWWDETIGHTDKGHPIYDRRTVWDWEWATINMLETLPNKYRARLKEAGFTYKTKSPTADVDCLFHSKQLGMGKDEYIRWREAGALIQADEELKEVIRTALAIKRRATMRGDFLKQLNEKAAKLT